ncbi:glycoside hydrolase [Salinibacterium sp. SYSU T00001]|uniref:sialidase family protein n=1 Tax=Homoserinimonas sedimenticola TaxID=2986805 RepID=UPI002235C151|nr:sialidase family protein [Salinibacterium sedimenticola]MCW4384898.1 glycoside hydrolase [Salinibacterium sedimenticola]
MMPRRMTTAASAALLALVLGGCSFPAFAERPLVEVGTERIDVPESMLPSEDSISVGAILPATDGAPWAFGGARAPVGGTAEPTVWTSSDGRTWTDAVVDDVDGSFSGTLAGSAEITALAGEVWKDGRYTPALWTSHDRMTWTPVAVPGSFAASGQIDLVTVVGSEVHLISTDNEGAATGVTIADGEPRELSLPAVEGEDLLNVGGLAGNGEGTLLLTTAPSPRGVSAATVTYLSDDGGATWKRGGEIGDEASWVAAVAPVRDGFVATGSVADAAGTAQARAWFSHDGESWREEALPFGNYEGWQPTAAGTWLGVPSTSDGGLVVMLAADNALKAAILHRDAEGAWQNVTLTAATPGNGVGGYAAMSGEQIVGLTSGSGEIRLGRVVDGSWHRTMTLSKREDILRITDVHTTKEGAGLTLSRPAFTYSPLGWWRSFSEISGGMLRGGEIVEARLVPSRLESLTSTEHLRVPEGELVLGTEFTATGEVLVHGYFRATESEKHQAVTGFPTAGVLSPDALHYFDGEWIAVMERRASAAVGTPTYTEVWSSTDGITWSKKTDAAGDGANTDGTSTGYSASCVLPDGSLLLVGHKRDAADRYFPTAWRFDDEWLEVDLGDAAAREGYATSCASRDDGIVLSLATQGHRTLMHSVDGTNWAAVFDAEPWMVFADPIAVDGGYASAGIWRDGAHEVGAVWLSADGTEWTPVAIPAPRPFGVTRIDAVGDDLLVSRSADSGAPVLMIRNIADAIQEHATR